MKLKTDNLILTTIENKVINDLVDIYNSNTEFLRLHMDKDKVTKDWLTEELEEMKNLGFNTYIIIEKFSKKIIGIVDVKIADESYISLLMIHGNYKNKGYGKEIYVRIEEYIKSTNSKSIRIDVAIDYDNRVLSFWRKYGFEKVEEIELNWTGKQFLAATMRKYL